MANQTFADFFAGARMTQLAAAATVRGNVPRVLPDAFYTPGPTRPFDDKVQFPSVTWNRTGASVVARGSPPRAISLGGVVWNYATLFNMKEEMELPFDFLTSLFSDFPAVRDGAMAELNRRMIQFNQRTDITRTQMVQSIFANAKIWIGSDGQVLASSSGAVITMDPGVPTANLLTKDGAGSTYNMGDWSSASTDIQGKLRGIQSANMRTNNYLLDTILYGENIPTYLATNTNLNPYFIRNPGFQSQIIANNDIPNGMLGFNWIPTRLAYSVNNAGTVTATFPTNFLAVMPSIGNNDWYEAVEGGTQIPAGVAAATEVVPTTSLADLLSRFRTAYGKYAYGVSKSHPVVGLSMVQGDVFGPVMKVPTAYYPGTVS